MTIVAEKTAAGIARRMPSRGRTLVIALVAAGLAIVIAANAHFLYVAVMSQPDCVAHSKQTGAGVPGIYAAAKSAC